MKARYKLILGRRRHYPLNIDLEVYKGAECRVFIATGIVLEDAKQWDASRQIVVKNTNAKQYNQFLQNMIAHIEQAESDAEERNMELTPEAIRMAARNESPFDCIDVVGLFTKYVETSNVKEVTKQGNRLAIRKLYEFYCKKFNTTKGTLLLSHATKQFIAEFNSYLRGFGYTQAYMAKYQLALRSYFSRAEREGLINSNPYDGLLMPSTKSNVRNALTSDQLQLLEDYDRSKFSTVDDLVLDAFLLSCYTGLRCSDVTTLLKTEIHHDAKGLVIERVSQKTGIKSILPLYSLFEGKGEPIVKKYLEKYPDLQTLFPLYDKSTFQKHVKVFGKSLNLSFPLTFHVSRHTCASLLAERVDNPFVIMSILGHGDINTSMRYIHLSHKNAEKKLSMANWNEGHEEEYECISNEVSAAVTQSIQQVCETKQISGLLTRLALGVAICNPDKATIISDWIAKIRKKDYTAEAFNKRLQMLVE